MPTKQSALSLVRGSFILFLGSMVGSVANYLFHLKMGRMLGPANYGVVVSLLALLVILQVPASAIQLVATRFTASLGSISDLGKIKFFWRTMTKKLFWAGLAVTLILGLLSPLIARFLNITQWYLVTIIALVFLLAFLLPLNRGLLQGLQDFKNLALNGMVDPVSKLILAIIFVALGWAVFGAAVAIVLSFVLAYIFTFFGLKKVTRAPEGDSGLPETKGLKKYSLAVLVSLLLTTVLFNIDVVLVKHFFPQQEAGLYGALSTSAKIIFFIVGGTVPNVMFPMITGLVSQGKKHYYLLVYSLLVTLGAGGIILIGYFLFPRVAINVLFGHQYLSVAPYLGFLGVAILLYALLNLMVQYFLSVGNYKFMAPLAACVLAEIGLIWFYHADFWAIIRILIAIMAVGALAVFGLYLGAKREQIREIIYHHPQPQ